MSSELEANSETPPSTTYSNSPNGGNDIVKDTVMWRRKRVNATVLVAATATWVLMEVFQFNFLTVFSCLVIFVVASVFLYANMRRFFGQEPPNLSKLEMSEETAANMANTVRAWNEEAVRWLFRVGAEEEWHVFVGVVAGLLALSYIATFMDLLTLVYIGILAGTTIPVSYVKNEDKIKRFMDWMKQNVKNEDKIKKFTDWLKQKYNRSYEIIDEKAIKNIKGRIVKEKKVE